MAMSPDEEQAFLETFLTYTGMLSTNTLHANLVRGGHHVSTATLVKTENEDILKWAVGAGRTARTPTPATPTRGFGTPKTPIGVAKLTDGGEKAVQALFEAYSSWGSRPNSTYMEFPKFAKLCRDMRVFGFRVSLATARQTFCVARQSKHDPSLPEERITFWEFVDVLSALALVVYSDARPQDALDRLILDRVLQGKGTDDEKGGAQFDVKLGKPFKGNLALQAADWGRTLEAQWIMRRGVDCDLDLGMIGVGQWFNSMQTQNKRSRARGAS